MNRLTYRTDNGEYTGMPNSIEIRTALEKLSKIEDIEEELGIDFITLLKALKNGVWFKTENNEILYAKKVYISYTDGYIKLRLFTNPNLCKCLVNVSGYRKTWALTKEELENEKTTN